MPYNKVGKRQWLSLYQYRDLYPEDFILYDAPDFRVTPGTCKWCGGQLKNKRQKSFCNEDCSVLWARDAVWGRTHGAVAYRIICRDKFACQECGANLAYKNEHGRLIAKAIGAEVHHIIQVSDGGTDHKSNLITLCTECHKDKHRRREVTDGQAKRTN